jgi:uncharacterized protein YndB with AHSA1/START domain
MNEPASRLDDRTFRHTRVVSATADQLFSALADQMRVARWWGPDGFTSTITTFDCRAGGDWVFVMHSPDGTNYPNVNRFVTIEAPSLMVIEHVADVHHFVLTIALTEVSDGTHISWLQQFDTSDEALRIRDVVTVANEQVLDRWVEEAGRSTAP